jgi:pyruvate/2-oxoglutarate/acetoin dehydrogenase E1 component
MSSRLYWIWSILSEEACIVTTSRITYAEAILSGFRYLLSTYPEVFVIGQGLWSPWYVGTSMANLDREFGVERIIDSPVSEAAVTGVAIGTSTCGYRPIVVHPRMDFMVLAVDQIVNQAAKWSHMFGGQTHAPVTVRGIINRGGEQGAQHSQALHAWFAHIPGLRVVMPATPEDARDLLIASVLSNDPVLYIDDRWLYDVEQEVPPIVEKDLCMQFPLVARQGVDCTLVGSGYTTQLCLSAADTLGAQGVSCEVVDLRVLNPLRFDSIVESVRKTGRLVVVDGGWRTCGVAGEVIAGVVERIEPTTLKCAPMRLTLPDAPAPTSKVLEDAYYLKPDDVVQAVLGLVRRE